MRGINLLIAFAGVVIFGSMLCLAARVFSLGYHSGWWGNGLLPIMTAVGGSAIGTGLFITLFIRMTR